MKLLADAGAALTAALEDQRRTDLCRMHGVGRVFVDVYGPTSHACGSDVHELCAGTFTALTIDAPCLCNCHASTTPNALEQLNQGVRNGGC